MNRLKAATEAFKNRDIASALNKISGITAERDGEIIFLRNRVTDLGHKVRRKATYSPLF